MMVVMMLEKSPTRHFTGVAGMINLVGGRNIRL
jgi:hypothetical protein